MSEGPTSPNIELELAQARLAAIVDSADDAIISKTLAGIVTSWNRGAQRLFGYTAEEMIGQSVMVLIPPDHANEEPAILAKLAKGERIEHYETVRRRKDGSLVDISLTVSPIRDRRGNVVGASKIARDITDRKRVEVLEREALQRAQDAQQAAETISRSKDEFIATVSHELRTPLTAVVGWVRMLTSGQLDAKAQKKALEVIDRNIRFQAQLIEDLLDISRIISGKLRLNVQSVEPASLISAAVESIRPAAEAKGIRILTVLDSSASLISGDPERLQQVLWNLLSNAIKFTGKDGRVQIMLQRVESHLELSVSDTGIGLDPAFLPYVFNRFTQADSSITRVHGGLGMGLAIVRSIVELHGGTVAVTSPGLGHGSTFTVRVPVMTLRRPRMAEAIPESEPALELSKIAKDFAGLKVLVVDDEFDTCEMLSYLLKECNAEVRTAMSAAQGLDIMDSWNPDVLISDIGMPEVDGYELIRRVRAGKNGRIPAVALTALARVDDRMKALSAGYHMHVAKPVEPMELLSIVAGLATLVPRANP